MRVGRIGWCLAMLLGGAGGAQERGAAALGPLVHGLGVSTRVLMIGAHPDDEDTQLIAWLARGRQVETAYLSLTRGDGGQNIVGNELGEALGVIRTHELLAARRLDGGRQYFTRAYDYGFSKSAAEAFTQWNRDSVLRDVVTVVRAFKPHVIVSIFTGTPADGHGHHQAAGLLARDAYDLSADTARFPRAATAEHGPWTVAKFYRAALFRSQERATLRMNVGEYDPLTGRSHAEVAAESRSQHRSQAMGALQQRGVRFDQLMRETARVGPDEPRSERSLFDGLDTTWARFAPAVAGSRRVALDSLPWAFAEARRTLDVFAPHTVLAALARVQRLLSALCGEAAPDNPCAVPATNAHGYLVRNADLFRSVEVASARVEAALAAAAGVVVEATVRRAVYAVGDTAAVVITTHNRGRVPVTIERRIVVPPRGADTGRPGWTTVQRPLGPDSSRADTSVITLSAITQPWWIAEGGGRTDGGSMFGAPGADRDEGAHAAAPTVFTVFAIGDARFGTFTPVVLRYADPVKGEINAPVAGAPGIAVSLERDVEYARANTRLQRAVRVHLRSHFADDREVEVSLRVPEGLVVDSPTRRVRLAGAGRAAAAPGGVGALLGLTGAPGTAAVTTVTFQVTGRLAPGRHVVEAVARSGGREYRVGYATVSYDHIGTHRIYRPAELSLQAVSVVVPRTARVGYIAGVGDNVAPALEQLGIPVTRLDPATLSRADLSRFSAIVIGPRAYEAHEALVANNARLLEYARAGGTLVVQYGQYEMLTPGIMPYAITLARPADRVTLEGSPVTILRPQASVLATPNRIGTSDFEGWVQDRSLYMPRTFAEAFQPVIEVSDPGESPNRGSLLVAPYGRGTYVYTSLAFFRQLPNGVPGAARLFINLLAAQAARVVP